MVQIPKYKYSGKDGLYFYNQSVINSKINEIVDKVSTEYNGKLYGIEDDYSSIGIRKKKDKYLDITDSYYLSTAELLSANKPSKEFITSILYNGGINGEWNIQSYTKRNVIDINLSRSSAWNLTNNTNLSVRNETISIRLNE